MAYRSAFHRILAEVYAELLPQQQELYRESIVLGRTAEEIAVSLGKTPNAVRQQTLRMRQQIVRSLLRRGETRETLLDLLHSTHPFTMRI